MDLPRRQQLTSGGGQKTTVVFRQPHQTHPTTATTDIQPPEVAKRPPLSTDNLTGLVLPPTRFLQRRPKWQASSSNDLSGLPLNPQTSSDGGQRATFVFRQPHRNRPSTNGIQAYLK
ncbi:hypothetical protein RHGRI_001297 [Rhododendron griersonianum]|uniref:Uncharacterized protein n=1 Tax=Rhododendron griersonianum TaxID=479676 RepID=A0AAV6LMJ9_9ERIC|nr:hypothetical protein RHGRI_001297 [Rhododendron griersonianum]